MEILKAAIPAPALSALTAKQAWHYRIVPFGSSDGLLNCYIDQESMIGGLEDELELLIGKKIMLEQMESGEVEELLKKHYPFQQSDSRQQTSFYDGDGDHFLSHLISEAQALNSSDIHIEAFESKCRVRIRVDGMLIQRYLLDKKQYPSLINKIKISSRLDIAEKRLAQDGRIFFENDSGKFDIRVSVLPTLHGEKVVLRLLNSKETGTGISSLGFSPTDLEHYLEGTRKPNGIILISGPTGSGKTTTLYSTLKILNKETRNILTIEDPIEYTLEGVNQVQLREDIGLTFPAALRSFLRQDPDIIMLGEIRDVETANMAIRASLTGHLVLSTIHTNSAWGIVSRLIDMGIAPYLLANTLNTAVAQRLVRLLCPHCKKRETFEAALYPRQFRPQRKIEYHSVAQGCSECFNTGYKGRKAVYEVVSVDDELAEQIKKSNYYIQELFKAKGIKTLA
ncbi:MAG TPA: GspE/PulE family protein, partial [Flavisolibacter sp.]